MVTRVRTAGRSLRAAGLESDVRGLADDHALLLRGVQRRAASVVALAAARAWPYAELDTLTGFLRTAVLPHAIDAADRLDPDGVAAPFTQLRAEHAHISALTAQLEHVDATTCTLPELRRLVDDLEHHMIKEHAVLAALLDTLEDTSYVAYLDPDAPEQPVLILIDALRVDHTVQMRVNQLRPGQPAQIHAARDNALGRVNQPVDGDGDPVSAPAMGQQPGGVRGQQMLMTIDAPI
ncbi:MAG: hypothetical protein ACJ74F_01950 [Mycobacterium sp.]|jgi:hypothetical protein|uniref:hypothetical protein n=1 Tax=Mycobacterium sp. TaxID=1785 RepID=UPI00389AA5AB